MSLRAMAADYVALMKPGITAMAVFVAAGAALLAPGPAPWSRFVMVSLGVGLIVGAANSINMVMERDVDALMERTRTRPLPAGRMEPAHALTFGVVLSVFALVLLALTINWLTAALALGALLNYVLVYTPLKRRSPLALIVGAPSGAMPVLMGWTAVTGRLDVGGLILFAILFVWQLPHFLAITLFRKAEYAKAGIRVVPVVRGDEAARVQALAWATALVPLSLALVPAGVAGWPHVIVALAVNGWFLSYAVRGMRPGADEEWARSFFRASLVYVPVLSLGLGIDQLLR